MIEEALTTALASVASGRRYWVRAPQDAQRPYVVLHRVSGVPSYTFCDRSITASRVQANCIADSYGAAKQLSRDLIAALDKYSAPGNGLQAVFIDSDGRDLPAESSGGVDYLYGVAVDLIAHHT